MPVFFNDTSAQVRMLTMAKHEIRLDRPGNVIEQEIRLMNNLAVDN